MNDDLIKKLNAPLPDWAVKPHPTKTYLSVIHPMAVIDRLNEVFGHGRWGFSTEPVKEFSFKTAAGKTNYHAAVKGIFTVSEYKIHLEQYGGSSNEDLGDALKGAATDSLTKIGSYLGIGASIYKGQGNGKSAAKKQADDFIDQL